MKTSLATTAIPTVRTSLRLALLGLLSSLLSVAPLHAGVLFTFTEVGSDVVATTSGSIGTGWFSDWNVSQNGIGNSFLSATTILGKSSAGGMWYFGSAGLFTLNNQLSGVSGTINNGSATGDFFGYSGDASFHTPTGVNEGESFSPDTTITWANETFASLGLETSLTETPLVLFTLNNNDTISANLAAVPEPSTLGLLACGALGMGGAWYRRRKRAGGSLQRTNGTLAV